MISSRHLIALFFSFIATMLVGQLLARDDPPADPATRGAVADDPTPGPEQANQVESAAERGAEEQAAEERASEERVAEEQTPEGEPTEAEIAAVQAGPKALSLAFRMASKKATPSVVVLFAYGQGSGQAGPGQGNRGPGNPLGDESDDGEGDDAEDELPLLERAEIPTPPPAEEKLTGIGSGVVVSEDGLIITNHHVIRDAKKVVVQLPDETRIDADVFRGDPESDVGMLRVETSEELHPIAIGDSDKLEIGDWVLAIGSPFKLEATVSAGIISAKNRHLERIRRSSMLQTDAAINPGNSGGALIDLEGKVVGISTAIATRTGFYQGVGFAIPINQARWIANELDRHGKVRRAAIGTTLADLKPRIAKQFDLEPYSGILIYQVIKDSVAEKAGLEPFDVIVEFAGERVRDSTSLQEVIERTPIGSEQPIVVRRAGKRLELTVELATVDDPTGGE